MKTWLVKSGQIDLLFSLYYRILLDEVLFEDGRYSFFVLDRC